MTQELKLQVRRQCQHLYPALVTLTEEGLRRARCLSCNALGPMRVDLGEAMRALREAR